MAKPKARFTHYDVRRALKGAQEAGVPVARFEIDRNGKIVVYTWAEAAEGEG